MYHAQVRNSHALKGGRETRIGSLQPGVQRPIPSSDQNHPAGRQLRPGQFQSGSRIFQVVQHIPKSDHGPGTRWDRGIEQRAEPHLQPPMTAGRSAHRVQLQSRSAPATLSRHGQEVATAAAQIENGALSRRVRSHDLEQGLILGLGHLGRPTHGRRGAVRVAALLFRSIQGAIIQKGTAVAAYPQTGPVEVPRPIAAATHRARR